MKKIIAALIILCMSAITSLQFTTPVSAACNETFLGLPTWYSGLVDPTTCEIQKPSDPKSEGQEVTEAALRKYVFTIIMNVMSLVLGLIGYVAIGFVMWGGFQYMLSQGDPGKAAAGRKTIVNSLIGLGICMTASIISNMVAGIIQGAYKDNAGEFYTGIANKAFVWAGIICAIIIVISGIYYVISVGDPGKVAKAKNALINAIIGLVIVISAAAIVNVLVGAL